MNRKGELMEIHALSEYHFDKAGRYYTYYTYCTFESQWMMGL